MAEPPPHARTAPAFRELLYYPYDCSDAIRTHSACLKDSPDWRRCADARDAMDACLEAGERRRFTLDAQCNRWKRGYQACLLEEADAITASDSACRLQLERLGDCVRRAQGQGTKV